MAYTGRLKFSLQDAAGDYYFAVQNADNSWTVSTTPTLTYLEYAPIDWENISITWERNVTYWGVFRSMSKNFQFVKDARAICLWLLAGNGGVNAYAQFTVYMWNEDTLTYDTVYVSEIDLSGASDDKQNKKMTVATLDSGLLEALKANADNEYNIPLWEYVSGVWGPRFGTAFVRHDGIKSLWRFNMQSPENYFYTVKGFNGGRHGTGVNEGAHTLPALANYTITQANGTTTFAGNDLLEPVIQYGNQSPRLNEVNFLDNGNINAIGLPLKPVIPNVDLVFGIDIDFDSDILFTTTGAPGVDYFLKIVVFEINEDGEPTQTIPGRYDVFATLYSLNLGTISPFPNPGRITAEQTLSLTEFKTYVIGFTFDDISESSDTTNNCIFVLKYFRPYIRSNYNSGTSTPVSAPVFPVSAVIGYKPQALLNQIVKVIDSTETDAYGFPIPTGSGYTGVSDFLSNDELDPADNFDLVPYNTIETSENAIRNIIGAPYISKSLKAFFTQWRNINMMGLSIEGGSTIRMEPLSYYLDPTTEILELVGNVANLKILPYTEAMGNRISNGWNDPQTNKNFGSDTFCYPADWNIQLTKVPKTIDMRTTSVSADMYYIEKARVQNDNSNSSPSSSNGCIILQTTAELDEIVDVTNPGGETESYSAYGLDKYPTAQSTNPTTAPYISNLYYPDTAYNLGLDPASCLYRNGSYIASLCDSMPVGSVISFRKVYQQQYNSPSTPALVRPGMAKKLNTSFVISQVDDIQVSALGTPLFRPYMFEFDSPYPVNMYSAINTNPNGYISFYWENIQYKGFLMAATQNIGNSASTNFNLLAHPDTTDAQLQLN